jgi:hypothetical protein
MTQILVIIIIFNLRTAAFKAYCAIWVRRSKFRHQASPRMLPREGTQRRKVELGARNVWKFCLNADFHVTFRDLLHFVKLRHGTDGFTSPPKEGVLRIFSPLKFRRLRPGVNPRTWIPKASTLPLDHRSRLKGPIHIQINLRFIHNKSRTKRQFITLQTTRKIMYSLTMVFFRHGAWQVLVHILVSLIYNIVESKDCGIGLIQSITPHIVSLSQDRQHDYVAHILLRVLINLQQTRLILRWICD